MPTALCILNLTSPSKEDVKISNWTPACLMKQTIFYQKVTTLLWHHNFLLEKHVFPLFNTITLYQKGGL